MAAIPRVMISHKILTHHLIPTATLEISETAGGVFGQTKPDIKLAFSFFWGRGRGGGAITCFVMDFVVGYNWR